MSCIWDRNFRGQGHRGVVVFVSTFGLLFLILLFSVVCYSPFSFLVERRKEGLCNDFARSLLHERDGLVEGTDDDDYDQRTGMNKCYVC